METERGNNPPETGKINSTSDKIYLSTTHEVSFTPARAAAILGNSELAGAAPLTTLRDYGAEAA